MNKRIKAFSIIPFLLFSFSISGCKIKSFNEKLFERIVQYGYTGNYNEFNSFLDGREKGQILVGTYIPVSSIGNTNDLFINLNNLDVYLKDDVFWYLKGNLNGSPVEIVDNYKNILTGTDNPVDTEGENGDLFINCTTGNVFQKIDNSWKIIGSIPDGCGTNGTSAYQKYCEKHPDYSYSEGRWINDMFTGVILEAERHTITFDANGGTLVDNQYVVHGKFIEEPKSKLTGWLVDNWFYNGEAWNFETDPCLEDMNLVANWIKDENTLMISEICSKNRYSYSDYYNEPSDYIELWNGTTESINLNKYKISNGKKTYSLPNVTIKAKSFLMIIADNRSEITPNGEVHVPFTLSQPKGGKITIYSNTNFLVDSLAFPDLKDDVSFGCLNGRYSMLYATGGEKNQKTFISNVTLNAPTFSAKSGVYNNEFDLKIQSNSNKKIIYTTDSSEPSLSNGIEYSEPIHIYDKTNETNIASSVTDLSANQEISAPDSKVKKCFVIKAICVENDQISPVVSSSFWIDENNTISKDTSLISLSTDYDNLFDYEKGIYRAGKIFDEYKNSDQYDSSLTFWNMPANYTQKGYEWEREGDITFIEKNGNVSCEQRVGLRIHGNSSRAFAKKSFNVYSRYNYDKNNKFTHNFNGKKGDTFVLKGIQEYGNFVLSDFINQEVIKTANVNVSLQDFHPVILYLNGEYWGYYFILDTLNADYLENNFETSESILIKNGKIEEGHPTDEHFISDFYSYTVKDYSISENIDSFKEFVDVQSYIEYCLCQAYLGNNDWSMRHNIAIWKTNETGHKYNDGKFRFILYDADWGGGVSKTPTYDSFTDAPYYSYSYKILEDLCKNDIDIKNLVLKKAEEIVNELNSKTLQNNIKDILSSSKEEVIESYNRYGYSNPEKMYNNYTYQINLFIKDRPSNFLQIVKNWLSD